MVRSTRGAALSHVFGTEVRPLAGPNPKWRCQNLPSALLSGVTFFYLLCNSSMVTMNRHPEAFRDIKALIALQRGSRASACRYFELKGGM